MAGIKKSLAAAFLAAATLIGGGAIAAPAQASPAEQFNIGVRGRIGPRVGIGVDIFLSDSALEVAAYGPQTLFYRIGRGFSEGIVPETGEHIGLEYELDGFGRAYIDRVYDLDDPLQAEEFELDFENALLLEQQSTILLGSIYHGHYSPCYRHGGMLVDIHHGRGGHYHPIITPPHRTIHGQPRDPHGPVHGPVNPHPPHNPAPPPREPRHGSGGERGNPGRPAPAPMPPQPHGGGGSHGGGSPHHGR